MSVYKMEFGLHKCYWQAKIRQSI